MQEGFSWAVALAEPMVIAGAADGDEQQTDPRANRRGRKGEGKLGSWERGEERREMRLTG